MSSVSSPLTINTEKILSHLAVAVVLLKKDDDAGICFAYADGQLVKDLRLTEQDLPNNNPVSYFGLEQNRQLLLGVFNGERASFEFRKRSKYYHCHLEPIADSGEITEAVGTITEVTEKRKIERNYSLLAHTINSLNESVSIADAEDNIVYVNPAFTRIYGFQPDEVMNKKSEIMWSSLTAPEVTVQILPATLSGGWHGFLYNKNKAGDDFLIRLRTSAVYSNSGEMIGVVGIANEVEEGYREEADAFARGVSTKNVVKNVTEALPAQLSDDLSQALQHSIEPFKKAYADCFIITIENNQPQSNFLWFSEQFDKNMICLIESNIQDSMTVFRSLMIKGLLDQLVNVNLLSLPDQVLNKLHHVITPYLQLNYNLDGDEPELNIAYCNISKNKQNFRFAGAHLNLAVSTGGKVRLFEGEPKPFAAEDGIPTDRYFKVHSLPVQEGDTLYLFTQSLFDQENAETESRMELPKFITLLEQVHTKPLIQQKHFLTEYLKEWIGENNLPTRNMLVMGIKL